MRTQLEHIPESFKDSIIYEVYNKGDEILEEGARNEFMYFIEEGYVGVYTHTKQGHKISISFFKEGESFGILEILDEDRTAQNVVALSTCKIRKISKAIVLEWMETDFSFNMHIVGLLQKYLEQTSFIMETLQSMTLKERIIVSLYKHYSDMTLRYLSKDMLIQETGSQRRTINRVLVELYDEGILMYKHKEFIILNIDELEDLYNAII